MVVWGGGGGGCATERPRRPRREGELDEPAAAAERRNRQSCCLQWQALLTGRHATRAASWKAAAARARREATRGEATRREATTTGAAHHRAEALLQVPGDLLEGGVIGNLLCHLLDGRILHEVQAHTREEAADRHAGAREVRPRLRQQHEAQKPPAAGRGTAGASWKQQQAQSVPSSRSGRPAAPRSRRRRRAARLARRGAYRPSWLSEQGGPVQHDGRGVCADRKEACRRMWV